MESAGEVIEEETTSSKDVAEDGAFHYGACFGLEMSVPQPYNLRSRKGASALLDGIRGVDGHSFREAEIGPFHHDRIGGGDEDVFRLDVAVHKALVVDVLQAGDEL